MLKNVRFGPCSSSSGSHPAPWLWPPPGSGPASAWPCSPPPPCSSPLPPTSGGGGAGRPAAVALGRVALLVWAGPYAAELGATDLAAISRWGDVRYVGLVLPPPAWFAFAALFAGRGSWVNRRNLRLL